MRPSYEAAAAAWRDHLEAGGTTPWCDFIPEEDADAAGAVPAPVNLELLRRLNLAGVDVDPTRVLTVAAPGRGMVEDRLPWPELDGHGRTPLQPDSLPPSELTRLAAAVACRQVTELEPQGPQETAAHPRRRVHAFGAPLDVAALRSQVRQPRLRRWTPGAVVLAPRVPDLLTQVWSSRIQRGGILPWARFVVRSATTPPRAFRLDDLVAEARRFHRPRRIHVIFDGAADPVPLLGARRSPGSPVLAPLAPAPSEFLRRCNLATRLWQPEAATLVRRSLITRLPHGPGTLAFAASARSSLAREAQGVVRRLAAKDVVVHGDPESWVASIEDPGRVSPAMADVADLAIATLVGVLEDMRKKAV